MTEAIRRVRQGPRDVRSPSDGFQLNLNIQASKLAEAVRNDTALRERLKPAAFLTVLRPSALGYARVFAPLPHVRECLLWLDCDAIRFSELTGRLWPALREVFGAHADVRSDGENVLQFRRADRPNTRVMFHGKTRAGNSFEPISYDDFTSNPLATAMLDDATRLATLRKRANYPDWWQLPGLFFADWIESADPLAVGVITKDSHSPEWTKLRASVKRREGR